MKTFRVIIVTAKRMLAVYVIADDIQSILISLDAKCIENSMDIADVLGVIVKEEGKFPNDPYWPYPAMAELF